MYIDLHEEISMKTEISLKGESDLLTILPSYKEGSIDWPQSQVVADSRQRLSKVSLLTREVCFTNTL